MEIHILENYIFICQDFKPTNMKEKRYYHSHANVCKKYKLANIARMKKGKLDMVIRSNCCTLEPFAANNIFEIVLVRPCHLAKTRNMQKTYNSPNRDYYKTEIVVRLQPSTNITFRKNVYAW